MKAIINEAESPVTLLTVIPARVRNDYRAIPFESARFLKGNTS